MNSNYQAELIDVKECFQSLQNESKLFEKQRKHLFTHISQQINYVITNFPQLLTQNHQSELKQHLTKQPNIDLKQHANEGQTLLDQFECTDQSQQQKIRKLLTLIDQLKNDRDIKIEQLQMGHKYIEKMKNNYQKQIQSILKENQSKISLLVGQKDEQINSFEQRLTQISRQKHREIEQLKSQLMYLKQINQQKHTENTQQIQRIKQIHGEQIIKLKHIHDDQVDQLKRKHRHQKDQNSLNYEKQIVKLVAKYQNQIDQIYAIHKEELQDIAKNHKIQMENIHTQHQKAISVINALLNKEMQKIQNLKIQQINHLQSKVNQLQTLLNSLNGSEIKGITNNNNHNTQQEQIKTLNQQIVQLKEQSSKIIATNQFLQSKNIDLFNQLQKNKRLSDQTILYSKKLDFLQKQLDETKQTLKNNKITLTENKKTIQSLHDLNKNLKTQITQKNIQLQSLQRQLQRTKNYNEILLTDVKSLNTDVKTLNSKLRLLDQTNHEMKKVMLTSRQYPKNIPPNSSRIFNKTLKDYPTHNKMKSSDYLINNTKSNQILTSRFIKQNQSLFIDKKDNSLTNQKNDNSMISDRQDHSLVIDRKDDSLILHRKQHSLILDRISPLSRDTKSQSKSTKSKGKFNITEQLRKRRQRRQMLKKQAQQPQKQQELVHLYSMETTFSPLAIPKSIKNQGQNEKVMKKNLQNEDKFNLFKKKNEHLKNYRQKQRKEQQQRQKNNRSLNLTKLRDKEKGKSNFANLTDQEQQQHEEQNIMKVSQQFKNSLEAYGKIKNYEFDEINQSILRSQQSRQILVKREDKQQVDTNSQSQMQGEFLYQNLKLTFKPKIMIQDELNTYCQEQQKPINYKNSQNQQIDRKLDNKTRNQENTERFLSLNSSFDDENNLSHEDIKTKNIQRNLNQKIKRQLPVHLLIGK